MRWSGVFGAAMQTSVTFLASWFVYSPVFEKYGFVAAVVSGRFHVPALPTRPSLYAAPPSSPCCVADSDLEPEPDVDPRPYPIRREPTWRGTLLLLSTSYESSHLGTALCSSSTPSATGRRAIPRMRPSPKRSHCCPPSDQPFLRNEIFANSDDFGLYFWDRRRLISKRSHKRRMIYSQKTTPPPC